MLSAEIRAQVDCRDHAAWSVARGGGGSHWRLYPVMTGNACKIVYLGTKTPLALPWLTKVTIFCPAPKQRSRSNLQLSNSVASCSLGFLFYRGFDNGSEGPEHAPLWEPCKSLTSFYDTSDLCGFALCGLFVLARSSCFFSVCHFSCS